MSRIGKKPVVIPAGVDVKVTDGVIVVTNGKKSESVDTKGNVNVTVENNEVVFTPLNEEKYSSAFWGTYRSLTQNAITGVTTGFKKQLEINGVGYRAAVKGKVLNLQLGHSHDINYDIVDGLTMTVEKNIITIEGSNNQVIGQAAAEIRAFRPPEPYKGKGVKYVEEHIRRKAGKTAKK